MEVQMDSKTQIKAALLADLIRYMGRDMVSGLAEPKAIEVEVEGPEMEEDDEEDYDKMDEKAKRMKKLKAMAKEC